MAKRFTDTDKWKKPYIRGLQGAYKLLWLYILDDCDHAGIWQVDLDVAALRIGEKLKLETALKNFSGKIYAFDNDSKWFIPSFIEFQYGELNPENRAHNSVIKILTKYDLNKPLTSPLQGAMDKDMDKDKELDKVKDTVTEIKSPIPKDFPFTSAEAKQAMMDYIKHRQQLRVKPYTQIGLEQAIKEWSRWGESTWIESVYYTIKKNYQGIVNVNENGNTKPATYQKPLGRTEPPLRGTPAGQF